MSLPPATLPRRERRLAERAARHQSLAGRHTRRPGLGLLSLFGLLGGLALVAAAIILSARPATVAADPAAVEIARAPAGLVSDGFALGRRDAPVTIDLYEDFQCPACERWSTDVFPSLAANELSAGTVRIVFHDMAFLGAESTGAGLAAYAAAQQGRFWDIWATIYANQARENSGALGDDRLRAMAQALGLDMARFDADRASDAARASIDASRSQARAAGVTSTPTLILDGELVEGVKPYAQLTALISAAAAQ